MVKDILPFLELNGQFDGFGWLTAGKLTDRIEGTPVPEPVEGALPKQFIYTVAHASGSESSVLFPWLFFCFLPCNSVLIRGYASAYSWSYSVAMLLLILGLIPWLCFCSVEMNSISS